ncbi:DNA polymerase [Arenicella xantha]|uniref:DNA polymerase n=2 Tax=Arenicella xantha TaxID=644221 RepID=A0A395JLP5_9GAMM|nr:DNA polymerase [Arenicella xantha]
MGIQRWRLRSRPADVVTDEVITVASNDSPDLVDDDGPEMAPVAIDLLSSDSVPLDAMPAEPVTVAESTSAASIAPKVSASSPKVSNSTAVDSTANDQRSPVAIRPAPPPIKQAPPPITSAPQAIVPVPPPIKSAANPLDDAGWQTLQGIIDAGNLCPTCSSDNAILGYGDTQAEWMFVFDAPTSIDLQGGQLCSGRAGKLFDAMLQAIGLERGMVYVTSVFKCAPTDDLALSPACHSMLRRQIELVQPTVVIAFGEFVAQSVLKANESLAQLREQPQRCFSTQIPIVPTYSPTQMLEDSQLKSQVWNDLKLAIALHQNQQGI